MAKEQRLIDAYTLAEEIEALRITVAGKPAKWNDAKHSVLRVIAEQADVDAVEVVQYNKLAEENEVLRRRLQHLLQSETVRMYDEIDPRTREYRRDIRQLDAVAGIVGAGQKVERIKTCKNVGFDVIYSIYQLDEVIDSVFQKFLGSARRPSMAERCVCCGEIIPEGRQVCPNCENAPLKTKLIKLIKRNPYENTPETIADHLIANGVRLEEKQATSNASEQFASDNHVGGKWIPVMERLPEEHDSTFAKFYGTEKWVPGMFRTTSNDVNACVEYEDGTRIVKTLRTLDGKWNLKGTGGKKVTHWMPLPQPPKGE